MIIVGIRDCSLFFGRGADILRGTNFLASRRWGAHIIGKLPMGDTFLAHHLHNIFSDREVIIFVSSNIRGLPFSEKYLENL